MRDIRTAVDRNEITLPAHTEERTPRKDALDLEKGIIEDHRRLHLFATHRGQKIVTTAAATAVLRQIAMKETRSTTMITKDSKTRKAGGLD
jgi:hypothetical protein